MRATVSNDSGGNQSLGSTTHVSVSLQIESFQRVGGGVSVRLEERRGTDESEAGCRVRSHTALFV